MWWNSQRRKRRKHGRTLSDNTKTRNSASCRTATSRQRRKKPKLNHHYLTSDYETENTHTAGSRTFEQATTGIDRRTKGIRFPPLLQALRHQRADGTNICTECGHSWKSDHDLADTICGCTCPRCGMELETLRTRKSVFSDMEYFSIVTTCKQYQVIRFFFRQVTIQGRAASRIFHL